MSRPSLEQYMLELARLAATRTTCVRRGVGCVLINARGHVLAIGYNGVAHGQPHCNEGHTCQGADLPPGQDLCEAIHAEQNAMLQCADPWQIDTAFVTLSPCKACCKLLLNTSCKRIVFLEEHTDPLSKAMWTAAGRTWQVWHA